MAFPSFLSSSRAGAPNHPQRRNRASKALHNPLVETTRADSFEASGDMLSLSLSCMHTLSGGVMARSVRDINVWKTHHSTMQ